MRAPSTSASARGRRRARRPRRTGPTRPPRAPAPTSRRPTGTRCARTCRDVTAFEPAQRRAAGRRAALRLRVEPEPIAFDDLVHGPQAADVAAGGDFIVRRADGLHAYQLAVVVDDGELGVSHVLRGDDLLSSTPR